MDDFYVVRQEMYEKRKQHRLVHLRQQHARLLQKITFLRLVVDGTFVFKGRTKLQLNEQLASHGLGEAEHLLSMSMWSMTDEKIQELCAQRDGTASQIIQIETCSIEQMWLLDLTQVEQLLHDQTPAPKRARPNNTQVKGQHKRNRVK